MEVITVTVKVLLKRLKPEDFDKVIIFSNGKGWTNINITVNENDITLIGDNNCIFSDDRL
jgi:hypothetical protein